MNNRTREKAQRLIIAALLDSDLSTKEVAEIGNLFCIDPGFSYALGMICEKISSHLEDSRSPKQPTKPKLGGDWTRIAMSAAKRKRKSKKDILLAIQALVSNVPNDAVSEDMSLREILQETAGNASDSEKKHLLSWLDSSASWNDEYLEGIMKNKQ